MNAPMSKGPTSMGLRWARSCTARGTLRNRLSEICMGMTSAAVSIISIGGTDTMPKPKPRQAWTNPPNATAMVPTMKTSKKNSIQ